MMKEEVQESVNEIPMTKEEVQESVNEVIMKKEEVREAVNEKTEGILRCLDGFLVVCLKNGGVTVRMVHGT